MDKITNRDAGFFKELLNPFKPPVKHDNHGNILHGRQITCANGDVIDLSRADVVRDNTTIFAAAGHSTWWPYGEAELGDIQSPFQTRCEQHASDEIER